MKNKIIYRLFLIVLLCCTLCCSAAFVMLRQVAAYADGEYTRQLTITGITVANGDKTINGVYSDPAYYNEDSASGYLIKQEICYTTVGTSDSVIYTALYPRTTTGRTGDVVEYACEKEGANYYVTAVNASGDGTTYIPVGGFVLSLNQTAYPDFAQIGDCIRFNAKNLTLPDKAVESSTGARIVVNNTNTTRSGPMVVYYDYQFGDKTGTNVYGTEMTCSYDFDQNTFKVVSFRGFGTGDDSGSDIPDNSFVLSAYGEGYRGLLVRGELFAVGDDVKMVGFDFIRFGGTVTGTYDYIDPTADENPYGWETSTSPFPAYRGNNQTIIYRYGWNYNGASGTGTNVYGFEAAVNADGVVVELAVNVSSIPIGGYVLSGHGTGRDFIRSNIVLGASVTVDESNKTYTVSTTLNSYYENTVSSVRESITTAQTRVKQLYDVDSTKINSYIDQVERKLEALKIVKEEIEAGLEQGGWSDEVRLGNLMRYNMFQLEVTALERAIIVASVESRSVAAYAVWHRPTETNYAAIENTVKTYYSIGINLVFVETLYNGYSAFRSSYEQLFPYNTRLGVSFTDGTSTYDDWLSAFVACAGQYGIEVHAWVEDFYVGTSNAAAVLTAHPDWVLYNDDGTIYQRNEGGTYIFLDPANTEVQDALIGYYLDLFDKFPDLAGLNLDYIRYPVSSADEDTGYTVAAMTGFAQLKGMTFTTAQLNDRAKMATKFSQLFNAGYLSGGQAEADANYEDWVAYRTQIITDFVRRIKTEVKDQKGILLSTAVFSSITESKSSKKQDWQTWFTNGWIDIATPMAYYTDAGDVLTNVYAMIVAAGSNCYYYAGLASSYSGLPAYQNAEQISAALSAGANGYVIFCSTQILGHDDVQEVLASVNIKTAVLPHAATSEVLSAAFEDILDKAQRIYIPNGGMTESQCGLLSAKFEEILAMSTEGAVNLHRIQSAVNGIYASGISVYAKGYSGQRITESLKEISSLLETKISVALIVDGDWDPETQSVRPTVTDTEIIHYQSPEVENPPISDFGGESGVEGWIISVAVCSGVLIVGAAIVALLLIKSRKRGERGK